MGDHAEQYVKEADADIQEIPREELSDEDGKSEG